MIIYEVIIYEVKKISFEIKSKEIFYISNNSYVNQAVSCAAVLNILISYLCLNVANTPIQINMFMTQ